ncbi:MAG: 16S rRNA (cytosine(1402)-N(4))-methyltransferase RsmH [Patescibacteria group bacterium]
MHIPVLTKEVKEQLNLKSGDYVIDATLDGGGHARDFLEVIEPNGKVLGIEQDEKMIDFLKSKILPAGRQAKVLESLIIAEGNFRNIKEISKIYKFKPDAVFFDLGMSTWHLKESKRGFSFMKPEEVLSMKLSSETKISAAEILNSYSKERLAEIFKEYGEEKRAYWFAKTIVDSRKSKRILVVDDLLNILKVKNPKILARIFQSLRIYINDEINSLQKGLTEAFEILKNAGRIAVISYHSLEDREVKRFFKKIEKEKLGKTLKKPIIPQKSEIQINPSARSAKLRVLWKIKK